MPSAGTHPDVIVDHPADGHVEFGWTVVWIEEPELKIEVSAIRAFEHGDKSFGARLVSGNHTVGEVQPATEIRPRRAWIVLRLLPRAGKIGPRNNRGGAHAFHRKSLI